MNRRTLLAAALSIGTAPLLAGKRRTVSSSLPVLDAHVHLFDPTRPGGVPWPEPTDPIFRPALPDRLQRIAAPLGVVGAIAIEASPLRSDNDWLLSAVTRSPFMVGMIGNLTPGSATFRRDLDRLSRSPLFLGIRYGNLWNRDLAADLTQPDFLPDLRFFAAAGLTFESANPTPSLLAAILSVAQRIPDLRIVIDHLPHLDPPSDSAERLALLSTLQKLAQSPRVFLKLSEVLTPRPDVVQTSSLPYFDRLATMWDLFAPDRILFGSDWPNSDHIASYSETLAVAEDYVRRRSRAALQNVLMSNAQRAYAWQPRLSEQIPRA